MIIHIGDKVKANIIGSFVEGKIERIEVGEEKEGGDCVDVANTSKQNGVVDLDNGHWCYFRQIKSVVERAN